MRILIRMSAALAAFAVLTGAASAREAETKSELALRAKPSSKAELLMTIPAATIVDAGSCAHGWCRVTWSSYSGYGSQSGLELRVAAAAPPVAEAIPVYPNHPYHAGHYPTADDYAVLPPYAAISPGWYRWRYFLTLREADRYRYVPYVFHNYKE